MDWVTSHVSSGAEMDSPIGFAAGNALEVLESVETLRVRAFDLEELVCIRRHPSPFDRLRID